LGGRHDGAGPGLGGLLGPARRLLRTVGGDTGQPPVPADGLHRGAHHGGPLLGRERLVLAERTVGADAVTSGLDEPTEVLRVLVEVDGQIVAERQGGGDDDAVPGLA